MKTNNFQKIFFYISKLFNVWFASRSLDYPIFYIHSLVICNFCLNIWRIHTFPWTHSWSKKEVLLIAFPDHCGYFSLILCQTLTGGFIKVSWIWNSVTLKAIGLSYNLDLLPMYDFITLGLVIWKILVHLIL